MTIKEAVRVSANCPAVQVLDMLTPERPLISPPPIGHEQLVRQVTKVDSGGNSYT